jgi:predicted outer membrane protein
MSMRRLMGGAAGGLMIAFGALHTNLLQAQQTQTADQQFIGRLAAENLFEVRLGQAAQNKATNPAVKQFAQRMVIDHTSMQKQWMALAKKNNLDFKAEINSRQTQQADQLKNLSGAEFDRSYMGMMVQNHRENVSAFQSERSVGHAPDFRTQIEQDLITLQEHTRLAEQVGSQVGSDMTASGGTPTDTTIFRDTTPTVVTQPGQVAATGGADSAFISDVDAANNAELRLARLAQSRASASQVKTFAQRMVTDHNRLQRDWTSLAARNDLRFQGSIRPEQQAEVTRLEKLSGTEFDREFMAAMMRDHRQHVNAFQTRGRSAQSAEVRELVTRSLPTLQSHLSMARQVATQIGADTVGVIAGETDGKNGDIRSDAEFIRDVDASQLLQVRLGKLAQKKGRNSAVKRFGERMEKEHAALQEQWSKMASKNGLKYQSEIGPERRANLDRLEKISDKAFDRAYMTFMIQSHNGMLNWFRKEGRAARSASVRQLVDRGLPTLEEHMEMAKRVGNQVGVNANAALAGRRASDR